jgi:hypothetical protein
MTYSVNPGPELGNYVTRYLPSESCSWRLYVLRSVRLHVLKFSIFLERVAEMDKAEIPNLGRLQGDLFVRSATSGEWIYSRDIG